MNIKTIIGIIILLLYTTNTIPADLPGTKLIKQKIEDNKTKKISELSSKTSSFITNFAQDNLSNLKYLDFNMQAQQYLKPTFNVMSVTEIFQTNSGTFFNQTSLNTHDSDETINIGLGVRELSNDDKLLIGSNIFYDYQFDEQHKRIGIGVEAISSVFDIRGNYYNALSGNKNTDEGSERALDGWDAQLDYHLPLTRNHELNIFVNAFKFKNPDPTSTYEEKGNKYGANAKLGNFTIEGGYMDDNQGNDSYFGSIKYVLLLNNKIKKDYYALSEIKDPISDKKMKDSYRTASLKNKREALEYRSVRDKLYLPVKRENKIRVVKISKAGVVASGF